MKAIAGVDIGGTSTKIGLINENGVIVERTYIKKTEYDKDINLFLDLLCKKIKQLCKKHNLDLQAVGLGAPNGNHHTGTIEFAPNLPWKDKYPVATIIKSTLKVPTSLTNDANAAAIGEMKYGVAKKFKDFIMITLGTGVGSGIVVDGRLVLGHDGFAAELGHTIIEKNGRKCNCGRYGCLEEYVSIRGILKTTTELLKDGKLESKKLKSKLYNYFEEGINTKIIADFAYQGDELAIEVFKKTGEYLAFQMANAVAFTSPEAIVFFGGIAQAGDILMNPFKEYFEKNLLKIYQNKVSILLSGLPENDAAILGSAALVNDYLH